MSQSIDKKCPKCGSDEFITDLCRYDVMNYSKGRFEVVKSYHVDDNVSIFCRDCGVEIDEDASEKHHRIISKIK